MRALTAATGVTNILGITLSALPTSLVEVASAAAGDPAMRRSAIELANTAADQIGVPGQLRNFVSALLRGEEPPPPTPGLQGSGGPGAALDRVAGADLIPGGDPAGPMQPVPAAPPMLPPPSRAVADAMGQRIINSSSTADSYAERLRAYIPIEVLSFFVTVNSAVSKSDLRTATPSSFLSAPTLHGWVAVALPILCVVAIIAYTRRTGLKAQTVWKTQASLGVIAFLVWTYAMSASFYAVLNINPDPAVSALCLGGFTLASGFVVPVTDT